MSPAAATEDAKTVDAGDNDGKDTKPKLTTRDQEILMAAWLCIKGAEPQVDYEKLASFLHLKNAHSASTIFYNVKKKIKAYQSLSTCAEEPQMTSLKPKPKERRKRAGTKLLATPASDRVAKRAKIESANTLVKEQGEGI